jgi:hypothetical protein
MAFAKDYKDVATRLSEIRAIYPELSLQQVRCELIDQGGQLGWLYVAAAFRTPDDLRPGMGTAFEPVPGKTPYTRDSELMVVETSAWGRALVAIGADTRFGVASADEVKARQPIAKITSVKEDEHGIEFTIEKPQETATSDFIKDAEYHAMLKNLDGLRGVYKNAVRHSRPQSELDTIKAMADKLDKK